MNRHNDIAEIRTSYTLFKQKQAPENSLSFLSDFNRQIQIKLISRQLLCYWSSCTNGSDEITFHWSKVTGYYK